MPAPRLDLAGQRFGRLTVVEQSEHSRSGRTTWRCVCDCGEQTVTATRSLRSGASRSCGCLARELKRSRHVLELTGQRFGTLIAVRPLHTNGRGRWWECVCDCGRTGEFPAGALNKGIRTHCGGAVHMVGSGSPRWKGHGELSGFVWASYRCGARYRALPFVVTIEEAWKQFIRQNRRCALTGRPLVMEAKRAERTASLDRIDSSLGYTPGNIQWVHKDLQRMKFDWGQDYFVQTCREVAKRHPKKKAA